jgi:hypothetical protein
MGEAQVDFSTRCEAAVLLDPAGEELVEPSIPAELSVGPLAGIEDWRSGEISQRMFGRPSARLVV